ncbi:MBL fold metallo-hydrolase [Sinorhizobium sp. 7-81]|uniref:MBL fold metallo-hydrolase n=1 Tax=Sinorhizobium sp. 8-89 TaxID=3049089 RepID=UPI0024C2797A|nr:MBL fold metallo-hydrolase [Sinorhizobium sp. 8-89]MDK1490357.1 MBL fold metallo-hydrolase [Sinorhizobium sp. 8-89]
MPRMQAPASGVTVRMYRQGHGDCFLLATPKADGSPFYMLIDCGLWTNSEVKPEQTIDKVIADIAEATGNRLDLVLVTHEHMDHVNGFAAKDPATRKPCFDAIEIGELWLAWTEDDDDPFANSLRERFHDTLLALMGADERLDRAGFGVHSPNRTMLRDLLSFETGEDAADELRERLKEVRRRHPALSARRQGALAIEGITNKRAIKYLRGRIAGDPVFLRPDHEPYQLPGVEGVCVYALGPPRDVELLLSLEPQDEEEFRLSADGPTLSLLAATVEGDPESARRSFDPRFGISRRDVERSRDKFLKAFFVDHYGAKGKSGPTGWRQIDNDWLESAETLALRLNDEVNNTSLVIAIELRGTGKVLLFTGDAQRGNWISWAPLKWTVDGRTVTARDLLGRTVLYKVGHHGSHNATLDGSAAADYANLSWLASEAFQDEFVAMIPANTSWAAHKDNPWEHPLGFIEDRLKQKARGRVFRSDLDRVAKPADVSAAEWHKFQRVETDLFFEYTVSDSPT